MSNPSGINSNVGKLIVNELVYNFKNQSPEYQQVLRIADQVKNQAKTCAKYIGNAVLEDIQSGVTKGWDSVSGCWKTERTSTSPTSGSGPLNSDSGLKNALSGIKNSFDVSKFFDGDISILTNCGDFDIQAGGKFDVDWEKFLLRGDMSALQFSYAYANIEGRIGASQLNAWVNYSNYSNCSGGVNFVLSNICAQFGWTIKDGEFANQSSISRYSQIGDIRIGAENVGRPDWEVTFNLSYRW